MQHSAVLSRTHEIKHAAMNLPAIPLRVHTYTRPDENQSRTMRRGRSIYFAGNHTNFLRVEREREREIVRQINAPRSARGRLFRSESERARTRACNVLREFTFFVNSHPRMQHATSRHAMTHIAGKRKLSRKRGMARPLTSTSILDPFCGISYGNRGFYRCTFTSL